MARKDRERARKRHAVERARREAGFQPAPKEERPAAARAGAGSRPGGTRRPGRGGASARRSAQPLRKMEVGDVDRRGRVYTRPMLLHPRIAMYIYFAVLGVGLVSLIRRGLQPLGYAAFAVGMLVIADSKPTWRHASFYIAAAVVLAAGAVVLAVSGVA